MEKSIPQTLRAPISKRSSSRGFTLIEIMVVVALIALISAFTIPTIATVFGRSVDEFAQELSGLFRECRDYALLKDKIVRIRFDLDKQQYWIEDGPATILLPSGEAAEKAKEDQKRDPEKNKSPFRIAKELQRDKKKIPSGIKLVEVLSPRFPQPIKEGEADFFYFPNGMSEAAVLHLEAGKDDVKRSLVVHPLNGTSKLVEGFVLSGSAK